MELPEKQEEFRYFIDKLRATGGKTRISNGLEALALAMDSDWNKEGGRHHHIIVVFASSPSHPLDRTSEYTPNGMPADFNELTDWRDGLSGEMDATAKRLILFTPDSTEWTNISTK